MIEQSIFFSTTLIIHNPNKNHLLKVDGKKTGILKETVGLIAVKTLMDVTEDPE
jgi:hypothetical protein